MDLKSSIKTLVQEKQGPKAGSLSASRVLPLVIGSFLVLSWVLWFVSQVEVIPWLPVIPWDNVSGGFLWLGGTFLSSVLPLIFKYRNRAELTEE